MELAKTYGLTHLAITVNDISGTLKFYWHVFDMEVMYHEKNMIQLTTPRCNDILVFQVGKIKSTGETGGIAHFGFRLRKADDIEDLYKKIVESGGSIIDRGEFVPGAILNASGWQR
ncbi:MAG TPA: VOC family protein [Cyclobacteriaceae bacterium]|nr:VOC family protein [Cyclobacteriaceae bacterium]